MHGSKVFVRLQYEKQPEDGNRSQFVGVEDKSPSFVRMNDCNQRVIVIIVQTKNEKVKNAFV